MFKIPEYCSSDNEDEIQAKVFDLIFAFDEVVALGYRENISLSQIRTFTNMDSQEEKAFNEIRQAQERAAIEKMRQKTKELKKQRTKRMNFHGLFPNEVTKVAADLHVPLSTTLTLSEKGSLKTKPSIHSTVPSGSKALVLGRAGNTIEQIFTQLEIEEASGNFTIEPTYAALEFQKTTSDVSRFPVHVDLIEELDAVISRSGGIKGEVSGKVSMRINGKQFLPISIQMTCESERATQFQVHPNLDKDQWMEKRLLTLKSVQKPFLVNHYVSILKWKVLLENEYALPFLVNCWPDENAEGCLISLEYTLQADDMTLTNVSITIPLPKATIPLVLECEGSYELSKSKTHLIWNLALIDISNKTGVLEFSTDKGHSNDFFPVRLNFSSPNLLSKMAVKSIQHMESQKNVQYSTKTKLFTENFTIT